jgi:outer membrane protein
VTVARVERALEAAEQELESLAAESADVERLFAEQRVAQRDLLAARAAAAAANQRFTELQRALEVARGRYNRLLGRPLTSPVSLDEVSLEKLDWNLDQLVQIAHEKRPDLRSLMAFANSHQFAAHSARATAQPQITASVAAQYDENRYVDPQSLATAAVVMDWKLFDGGKASCAADAERMHAESIRRLAEDLKAQIGLDLLNAWNQAAQAEVKLEAADQQLAHASENLRAVKQRFDRGMATKADVLDAQSLLAQATRELHNAQYDGLLAQLQLRYSAGLL